MFKRIAEPHFYPKSLMLYINGFVSTSSEKNWKVFVFKFQFRLRICGPKPKIFHKNSEAWILINVLYINGFISTSLTNQCKAFLQINFWNLRRKQKILAKKTRNIQKNSETWILIKLQCVIYQWIRLNKLYKHKVSFFSNFEFLAAHRIHFKGIERRE